MPEPRLYARTHGRGGRPGARGKDLIAKPRKSAIMSRNDGSVSDSWPQLIMSTVRAAAAWLLPALVVGTIGAGAQQRFKAGVDLVHFSVVVTDKQGSPITGLKAEDFDVVEEGKAQRITYFTEGDPNDGDKLGEILPLRLGLALDSSGSMDRDISHVRTGVIKFLLGNEAAIDYTLVDFDTEIRVTRYGPDETERLIERIRRRRPDGWTALYDAVGVYLHSIGPQDGQKILLLYTDGGDTRSELTFSDLLDLLKSSDVTVYRLATSSISRAARARCSRASCSEWPRSREARRSSRRPSRTSTRFTKRSSARSRRATASATSRRIRARMARGGRSRSG